jgi:hypothetical protein
LIEVNSRLITGWKSLSAWVSGIQVVLSVGREHVLRPLWTNVRLQPGQFDLRFALHQILIMVRVALTESRLSSLLELCHHDLFVFLNLCLNNFRSSELFILKLAKQDQLFMNLIQKFLVLCCADKHWGFTWSQLQHPSRARRSLFFFRFFVSWFRSFPVSQICNIHLCLRRLVFRGWETPFNPWDWYWLGPNTAFERLTHYVAVNNLMGGNFLVYDLMRISGRIKFVWFRK